MLPLMVQVATSHVGLPLASYTYQARNVMPYCCAIAMPQPDSLGFHQMSLLSTAGGVVPLASGWRVSATVRVWPAAVYVIEAAFAFAKLTCRLPALEAFTSDGLNAPPKKVGPVTS